MPATGHLSHIAKKKYGYRPDDRISGLIQLFKTIKPVVTQKQAFYQINTLITNLFYVIFIPMQLTSKLKAQKGALQDKVSLKSVVEILYFISIIPWLCYEQMLIDLLEKPGARPKIPLN